MFFDTELNENGQTFKSSIFLTLLYKCQFILLKNIRHFDY